MKAQLRAAGLEKAYGGTTVLSDVSLELHAGAIHALVGENGAGKSTLIKILTGAVFPDRGRVDLDGQPLPFAQPLAVRRLGVNVVYQEFTLVPGLSVTQNIFLGQENGRVLLDRSAMRATAAVVLSELGVVVDPDALVGDLSVARQQMVEIARALLGGAGRPANGAGGRDASGTSAKVLILDEPSATLSAADVEILHGVLRRLRSRGLAILYVSHRLEEIFALTDTVTVLRDGRHVITAPTSDFTRESLIRHMVGRDVTEEFPARSPRLGEVVLSVQHLAAPPRFHDVTIDIRAGEIVGLSGLVGAGRTSAALAIGGALRASGMVTVHGRSMRASTPAAAIQSGVAYVTEDRKASGIFPWLRLDRNITVTHQWSFAKGLLLARQAERNAADQAVRDFDIRASGLGQLAGTLSGGNQQKALVARYLVKPPRVLILDEPTRGVDVGARAEIYRAMNRLTAEGLGILMISSDLPEIVGMSDRVVVMSAGRTVGQLERSQATPGRIMAMATTGGA